MKNINKKRRIKDKGWVSKLQAGAIRQRRTHSCLTLPSTRGYTLFPSSNGECRKKYTFPHIAKYTRKNTFYTMISGRVTPFSCFALSTTRACTHVSHYQRMQKDKKSDREIPFLALQKKSEKLQVGKGRAPVVEILQSCCDWCCYLSSNQTSSCAQHSILNFGQIHA